MKKVTPSKAGIFPSFQERGEPLDLQLGNGSRFMAIINDNPDSQGIYLGIEGKGIYPFCTSAHSTYIAEKLNIVWSDACNLADFIRDQLDPDPTSKLTLKREGRYTSDVCEDFDLFPPLGSVSHATHREEDLIPRFMDVLLLHAPSRAAELQLELSDIYYDAYVPGAADLATEDIAELRYTISGWVSETLFDAMNEICPPWTSFGSSEGDGADFGYWVCQEGLREAVDNAEVYEQSLDGEAYDGGHSIDHDWTVWCDQFGYAEKLVYKDGREIWSV